MGGRHSLSGLRGHLWAEEDSLKKTEEALSREWFAITAFPLIAGTFGPIASALNICALVQPWRFELTPSGLEGEGVDVADPKWLIGVNALSLVFGIVANVSLFLVVDDGYGPLAERALQIIAVTIIGGNMASVILIALVVAVSSKLYLPSPPGHAFTEAFYYAIMAAVLYFITSTFVIYTAYMIWPRKRCNQGPSRIRLAKGHHRLMMLTVLFMAYILLGAVVFSRVEGWRYLDGVYWADVTILTVGFGDFKPSTHLGRSLYFPYAVCGIIILFLIIYCIPKLVFDRGKSLWEIHLRDQERIKRVQQREKRELMKKAAPYARFWRERAVKGNKDAVRSVGALESRSKEAEKNDEREARERDFKLMRDIVQRSARKQLWYSVGIWGSSWLLLWLVGAAVFFVSESRQGWTSFEAVYFAFTALLAIGYGDFTLQSNFGKAFFVLWSLIVVPTLAMLISTMVEAVGNPYVVMKKDWVKMRVLRKKSPRTQKGLSGIREKLAEDHLPHNEHDKNHTLAQVITSVVRDQLNERRPEYSFEDWEVIFYLMGVLESRSAHESKSTARDDNLQAQLARTSLEEWRDKQGVPDWLHGKNPLNSTETITEWMLLTLVEKLELELLDLRRKMGSTNIE